MAVLAPKFTGIESETLDDGGTLTHLAWKRSNTYSATIQRDKNGEVVCINVFFNDPLKHELYPGNDKTLKNQFDLIATVENVNDGKIDLSKVAISIEQAQKQGQNPFAVLEIIDDAYPVRYISPRLGGFEVKKEEVGISPLTRDKALLSSVDPLSNTYHFDYYQTKAGIKKLRERLGKDLVVLTIDISGMRKANEAGLGENVDAYISDLSNHISAAIYRATKKTPPQFIISRSGGDEFKVILSSSDYSRAENVLSEVERTVRDELMNKHFSRYDEKVKSAKAEYSKKYGTDTDFMTAYVVASIFNLSDDNNLYEDRKLLRSASRFGDGDLARLKGDVKNPDNGRDYLPPLIVAEADGPEALQVDIEHFASLDRFDHMREAYDAEKLVQGYSTVEQAYFDHLAMQAKIREPLEKICLLRLGRSEGFRPCDISPGLHNKDIHFYDIDLKNFSYFNSLLTDQFSDKFVVDEILATELETFGFPFVYRVSGGRFVVITGENLDSESVEALQKALEEKLIHLIQSQPKNEIERVNKTTSPVDAGRVSIKSGLLIGMSGKSLREVHQQVNMYSELSNRS